MIGLDNLTPVSLSVKTSLEYNTDNPEELTEHYGQLSAKVTINIGQTLAFWVM